MGERHGGKKRHAFLDALTDASAAVACLARPTAAACAASSGFAINYSPCFLSLIFPHSSARVLFSTAFMSWCMLSRVDCTGKYTPVLWHFLPHASFCGLNLPRFAIASFVRLR